MNLRIEFTDDPELKHGYALVVNYQPDVDRRRPAAKLAIDDASLYFGCPFPKSVLAVWRRSSRDPKSPCRLGRINGLYPLGLSIPI